MSSLRDADEDGSESVVELSSVASLASRSAPQVSEELSTRMLRKILDMQSDQGARLAQMVDQSSGVGRSIDTVA